MACIGEMLSTAKIQEATMADLNETARALVAPGKGILAADESTGTIKKRFDSIEIESTEESRRAYRDMLFTTDGAADHISGVILYDETIRQLGGRHAVPRSTSNSKGVIPGIKVDLGAKPLAQAEGETITEGLDGLRDRLNEYRELGAEVRQMARDVISIGEGLPSEYCLWTNAQRSRATRPSARRPGSSRSWSRRCSGRDAHDRPEREATGRVLQAVFTELRDQRIELPGRSSNRTWCSPATTPDRAGVDEVADATLECSQARAGIGPGHRLPLGWPDRRGLDRAP